MRTSDCFARITISDNFEHLLPIKESLGRLRDTKSMKRNIVEVEAEGTITTNNNNHSYVWHRASLIMFKCVFASQAAKQTTKTTALLTTSDRSEFKNYSNFHKWDVFSLFMFQSGAKVHAEVISSIFFQLCLRAPPTKSFLPFFTSNAIHTIGLCSEFSDEYMIFPLNRPRVIKNV